jgi:hypothetical protein
VKQEHQLTAAVVPTERRGLAILLGNLGVQSWKLVQLAEVQSGYSPLVYLPKGFFEGGPSPRC